MLRDKLVEIALQWQEKFGVAPQITTVVSEYDAAMLVGMPEKEYSEYMQDKTAVNKGSDFVFNHKRYQIKANRPSGKPGSFVTRCPKASNYEWDKLIWILYDKYSLPSSMQDLPTSSALPSIRHTTRLRTSPAKNRWKPTTLWVPSASRQMCLPSRWI